MKNFGLVLVVGFSMSTSAFAASNLKENVRFAQIFVKSAKASMQHAQKKEYAPYACIYAFQVDDPWESSTYVLQISIENRLSELDTLNKTTANKDESVKYFAEAQNLKKLNQGLNNIKLSIRMASNYCVSKKGDVSDVQEEAKQNEEMLDTFLNVWGDGQ